MSSPLLAAAAVFIVAIAPGMEIGWFAHTVAKRGFKAAIPTGVGIIAGRILAVAMMTLLSYKLLGKLSGMQNVYAAYLVLAGLGMLLWARRVFDAERVSVERPFLQEAGIGALLSATNPISLPVTAMLVAIDMNGFGDVVLTLFSVVLGSALALGLHALWSHGARKMLEPPTALKTVWTVLGVLAIVLGIRFYVD